MAIAVAASQCSRTATAHRAPATRDPRGGRVALPFTAPFFMLFALFLFWPVLSRCARRCSTTRWSAGASWAGLENYRELLGDPNFWAAMWHTALFTLLSVPPLVLLPLGLALLVSRVSRLQWLFRLAFFAPYVLPVSVVVLVWNWLYQPGFGLINSYLTALGLAEVNWLGQPGRGDGLGGDRHRVVDVRLQLRALPGRAAGDPARALRGRGDRGRASRGQQIRHITLPLLSSTIVLVTTLQVIASLKVFDQIYLLQLGTPGPENSTRPAIQYIYEAGLHAVPDRLRERDVVRVLPRRRRRGAVLAVARAPRRHADGDLVMSCATASGLVENRGRGWVRPLLYAVLAALALIWLVPLAWAVATSLKPDAETTSRRSAGAARRRRSTPTGSRSSRATS